MQELKINYYHLDDLKPYENNPRLNDNAVDYVANSIKEFGFKNPIIIDKNNVIVAGHTRYKACKKLKIEKVPCIKAEDLTDEQVKAFRLADNKVSEIALWDIEALNFELADININMEDFGFISKSFDDSILNEIFEHNAIEKQKKEKRCPYCNKILN